MPLRQRSHLNSEGGLPMGRGRSKAKQTKVARDLKYSNQEMDLEKLANELHSELDNVKRVNDNQTQSKGHKSE